MRLFLIVSIFFSFSLFSHEKCLQDFFGQAEKGDYIALKAGSLVTLIHIHTIEDRVIIIEEISTSASKKPDNFKSWVSKNAPGHTSWSLMKMDRLTGKILDCYSFSKFAHIQLTERESLLASLFKLPLIEVSQNERRKIGPEPSEGEMDLRKIWNPPFSFEGEKMKSSNCKAFKTTFPKCDSPLSEREIILYFDGEKKSSLPIWIDVDTTHITGRIQAVDAGKGLASPYKSFPKRNPSFIGRTEKKDNTLQLKVLCPSDCQDFSLFAVELTNEKEISYVSHEIIDIEGEVMHLQVDQSELKNNRTYHWMLITNQPGKETAPTSLPFQN